MLKVIKGDIFDSKEKYIVHQTNCYSTGHAGGLARDIFHRYPYADVYSCRVNEKDYSYYRDIPGSIVVRGNGEDQRYVVGLMGQFYPGGPNAVGIDDRLSRQKYFHQGLWALAQIEGLDSVAFPYLIGCGLAAGNWDMYYKIIGNFARYLDGKADVFIYHKE
jgi:O-acetyl-ADP-ribose deacetylase (regulator of RNase III)